MGRINLNTKSFAILIAIVCSLSASVVACAGDVHFRNNLSDEIAVGLRRQNETQRNFRSNWLRPDQSVTVNRPASYWIIDITFKDGRSQVFRPQLIGNVDRTVVVFRIDTRSISKIRYTNRRIQMEDGTVRIEKVPETRTESVTYLTADMSTGNGNSIVLPKMDENGFRTGITIHRCQTGLHIDDVEASGPATRCDDGRGTTYSLEKNDHIVAINGNSSVAVARYVELTNTGKPFSIDVKDHGNGVVRRLTIRPVAK